MYIPIHNLWSVFIDVLMSLKGSVFPQNILASSSFGSIYVLLFELYLKMIWRVIVWNAVVFILIQNEFEW